MPLSSQKYLFILFLIPSIIFSAGIEKAFSYSKNSFLQWEIAVDTLSLSHWTGYERVLDIGCGDGKVSAYLANLLPSGSVLGIDVSPSMVFLASSNYSEKDYPNLSFIQMDGAEIAFQEEFDKIVSFSALHWIIDQKNILNSIYTALASNGSICIQTYGQGTMNVSVLGEALTRTSKWKSYFTSNKKTEYSLQKRNMKSFFCLLDLKKFVLLKNYTKRFFPIKRPLLGLHGLFSTSRHIYHTLYKKNF